jgi:putative oxidoreductase
MPELESVRREQIGRGRLRYERRNPRRSDRTPWYQDTALALLRVVAGLMLVQHGLQKHFGLLLAADAPPFQHGPALFSQTWWAGSLELLGGVLLALGLFTRPVAFILSGMLAVAYFQVHAPRAFFPILNRGELAALYCFVFLMFAAVGGGRYSIDGWWRFRRSQ